jgi:flagella basal body P-ring formation protein FlgA
MIRKLLILFCLVLPPSAGADSLVASKTLRSKTILSATDFIVSPQSVAGAVSIPDQAIGMESREILYAGRPIMADQIGRPALVQRNEVVVLVYETSLMRIETEARALGRAGLGESIRVMNLSSRSTVTGVVAASGRVVVKK